MAAAADRLRALLEHARSSTAYYASRIPPLSPAADVAVVLASVPLLSRAEIRAERPRMVASAGTPTDWRLVRTTGTTGEPVEVVLDRRARAAEEVALGRHLDRCLEMDGWRSRDIFHLVLHAGASSRAQPSPYDENARAVKWNLLRAWLADDPRFLASLAHVDGAIVATMPSVAGLLARRVRAAGGTIRPCAILLSGETVDAECATIVAETFGCPVTSLYTLAEVGVVAAACLRASGYHAEESVVVEIVDAAGAPAAPGRAGDVVVTALENYAMPLIRYRTGDVGEWRDEPCGCEVGTRRLLLTGARRPRHVLDQSGGAVNVVRFAKVLASLDVDRLSLGHADDGAVVLAYERGRPLSAPEHALAAACLRAAAGPDRAVRIEHVDPKAARRPALAPAPEDSAPCPGGPDVAAVATWLRARLAREPGIDAAVLTGSALDPEATTRFSDLDLVVFAHDPTHPRWLGLAHDLGARVPTLAVSVDTRAGLAQRAPLLVCRLLCEQVAVVERLDESVLAWPALEDLRAQARFWTQDAIALLWQRLTRRPEPADPVREAALAGKLAIDALRFRYLLQGVRDTAARAVLEHAANDATWTAPWLPDLIETLEVAREHRPPPADAARAIVTSLTAALVCVRAVAASL